MIVKAKEGEFYVRNIFFMPEQFHYWYYLCHDEALGEVYWLCLDALSISPHPSPMSLSGFSWVSNLLTLFIKMKLCNLHIIGFSQCFQWTEIWSTKWRWYLTLKHKKISINHHRVLLIHRGNFFFHSQLFAYKRQNEWMNVLFVCEQLRTLIPFVLIKLVHKNTMLYQLCFDIFWFIQLKTVRDRESLRCWLSDIRVISCSVSFWFMKAARTNDCTHTRDSCLTARLDCYFSK